MNKFLFLLGLCISLFPTFASAQVASVASFIAPPATLYSGQPANVTWTLSNSGGSSYMIPCLDGLKLTNPESGSAIACGTRHTSSNTQGSAASLLVHNISGGVLTVVFQVYPKDVSGNDYDAGMVQSSMTVYPLTEPIASATFDQTSITSGDTATLTWAGQIIEGVNMQTDCNSNLTITSPTYPDRGTFPCGSIIFSSNLSASGSISLTIKNLGSNTETINVKILPAITATTYNGVYAKIIPIEVKPRSAPLVQTISYFSASSTIVTSGSSIPVSWSIENTTGSNMYLSCDPSLVTISFATASTTLPCNQTYIASTDYSNSSSLTFIFKSLSTLSASVTVTLVPALGGGLYDGTRSKTISLTVVPMSTSLASITPSIGITKQNTITQTTGTLKKARVMFTRALRVGMRGDDVKALQEFFAQDSAVYPEGLTTGYFGPATLRAIQRFQAKNSIVSSGTPETTGYGALGPKTRAFINTIK